MGNSCGGPAAQNVFVSAMDKFSKDPASRHQFQVVETYAKHLIDSNKGWVKGPPPSSSDRKVSVNYDKDLPDSVDLRGPNMPPVYNQGRLGSCTANAIAGAFQYSQRKNGIKDFAPSRLFIYYNERTIENDIDKDNGAVIKDGMKSIQDQGVCHEETWPYDVEKFDAKPPDVAYTEGMDNQALKFSYVQEDDQVDAVKRVLHAGWPVIFGFQVPAAFETQEVASSGVLPLPTSSSDKVGGHAILACGFDDSQNAFLIRNSWGDQWGDKGYFWMPYEYVGKLKRGSDFWVLNTVEDGRKPGHDDQGGASNDNSSNSSSSSGSVYTDNDSN